MRIGCGAVKHKVNFADIVFWGDDGNAGLLEVGNRVFAAGHDVVYADNEFCSSFKKGDVLGEGIVENGGGIKNGQAFERARLTPEICLVEGCRVFAGLVERMDTLK